MRVVIQKTTGASVEVDGSVTGKIGLGFVVLAGVGREDHVGDAQLLARKMVNLRIFEDEAGKTNLSLLDVGGEILLISQFTLYADVKKGRRPSFTSAGDPGPAEELMKVFRLALEEEGVKVEEGVFGAHMAVSLVNDGPFTLFLDTEDLGGGSGRDTTGGWGRGATGDTTGGVRNGVS